jgi:ADP-heptose:LPS heptosyltransferase
LPVIEALAAYFEHGIDLVVRGTHVPLVERLPSAGKVRICGYHAGRKARDLQQHLNFLRLGLQLMLARYRTVISVSYRIPCTMLTLMTFARRRIGLAAAQRKWVYNDLLVPASGPHKLDFYATVLQRIGIVGRPRLVGPVPGARDLIFVDRLLERLPGDARAFAVIHPFAGKACRGWPIERFVEVADRLAAEYELKIVLIGSPGERMGLEDLRSRMLHAEAASVVTESLPVTVALLSRMAIFVGNLSGPSHLAGLVGDAPIVCISGPTDKIKWRPLHQGENAILLSGPICESRCRKAKCQDEWRCIRDVQVFEVMDAIHRLLPSVSVCDSRKDVQLCRAQD